MFENFRRTGLIVMLFASLSPILGQQNVGGITGKVVDASGAVIPDATVTALHKQTGIRREAVTTAAGIYTFRILQIGDYTITVGMAGFKTYERVDIPVVSGETVTLDISLEVGQVTETATVTAQLPTLDTTGAAVGTTRTADEISRLPITLAGNSSRSAAGFARTVTGVNFNTTESGGQDFMVISRSQINGSMAGTWGYQIDGVEGGMGEAESGSDFMSPIPEAIEEFRLTANADATSGFNGGVSMEMTVKSGTNNFHGSAFWYVRNDALNARTFFDTTGKPSSDKQNDAGFVVGGPIWKNKTFFLTSIDIYRFRTAPSGQIGTVPTSLMRSGNFSEILPLQIYDPQTNRPDGRGGVTRDPFPGNILPQNRLSPVSLAFQKGYSLPTNPGLQNNWVGVKKPNLVDKDQWYFKLDHHLSSNHRFSFAYEAVVGLFVGDVSGKSGHSFIDLGNGFLSPEIGNGFIDDRDSYRYRFNYLWTLNPNMLFNFRAGVTRNPNRFSTRYPFDGPGATFGREAGLTGTLRPRTPTVNIAGVSGFGPGRDLLLLASQKTPFSADVTMFKGSHNLKLGIDFIALPFTLVNDNNGMGTFSFSDPVTGLPGNPRSGSGYASFLLGEVDTATVTSPIDQRAYTGGWAVYAQDQWRVNSKLTVNYGLRWNLFTPMRESQTKISTFDPTIPNPGAGGRLGALAIYGEGQGRNGLTTVADYYYKALAPNLGFAFKIFPKTVIRASYGISYTPYWQKYYGSNGPTQPTTGFSSARTAATLDNGVTPAFNWNNGFPLTFPKFPVIDPALQNGNALGYIARYENRPPMSQNINFEVGRELPGQMSIRVAWVANLNHRLPNGGAGGGWQVDLNSLPLSQLRLGSLLTANINSPEARAAGIPIPYPGFNGSVAQALRPYPQFLDIPVIGAQFGSSTYHSLQTNFQRRMGDLTFLFAYTISKQLTNVNFPGFTGIGRLVAQHSELRQLSKELLNKDRPQILNISWAYDLPFGTGKRFLSGAGRAGDLAVGGWRLSAIQYYFSGEPLRVTSRSVIPGGFSGIWPEYVAGQPLASTSCAAYNPANPAHQYVNLGAFRNPAPFTVGNISRLPNLRNCAFFDEALQIEKNFRVTEQIRVHVGTMMMNVFNRHIWLAPGLDINNPTAFGRFTNTSPPRNIQLFMKVEF